MGKNFLERQEEIRKGFHAFGFDDGVQYAQDCMVAAIHHRGYGKKRMMELLNEFADIYNEHFCAFEPKNPLADYHRELLDREMQSALGDKAEPFAKRYPYAAKIRYDKPQRKKKR